MHHDQAVAQLQGLLHVVGDHHCGQLVTLHHLIGQPGDQRRTLRVERRGVLVQQQNTWLGERRHDQRQRLPLASREQPDARGQPVLQAQLEGLQFFAELFTARVGDAQFERASTSAGPGDRQILLDRQVRAGAGHRVLEDPAHLAGHPIVGQPGDIFTIDPDAAQIGAVAPRHHIQQRRFAGAVRSDDGREIPGLQGQ
ncbi:hypothetical protein SDC9_167364 [bioreactor metagenome]|uniref:Uncharacterized protein n=1 Tax=bioreactor metagenome TaxID=1076179 RepID=A0A645G2F0_9ZZZZ